MEAHIENFYPLFKMLVQRTRVLATVCDNAATVLSTEFEDMITGPLSSVNEVLARCPDVIAWDGSYLDDDVVVEVYRHPLQDDRGPDVAVRLHHVPTDLSVESYSKPTADENHAVARGALKTLVRKRWEAEQQAVERSRSYRGPLPQ